MWALVPKLGLCGKVEHIHPLTQRYAVKCLGVVIDVASDHLAKEPNLLPGATYKPRSRIMYSRDAVIQSLEAGSNGHQEVYYRIEGIAKRCADYEFVKSFTLKSLPPGWVSGVKVRKVQEPDQVYEFRRSADGTVVLYVGIRTALSIYIDQFAEEISLGVWELVPKTDDRYVIWKDTGIEKVEVLETRDNSYKVRLKKKDFWVSKSETFISHDSAVCELINRLTARRTKLQNQIDRLKGSK